MEVKSTGKSKDVFFLNSEEDYKSDKNFTIFINEDGTKKFKEAKVDDLAAQFRTRNSPRPPSAVRLFKEKPGMVVDDPDGSRRWKRRKLMSVSWNGGSSKAAKPKGSRTAPIDRFFTIQRPDCPTA